MNRTPARPRIRPATRLLGLLTLLAGCGQLREHERAPAVAAFAQLSAPTAAAANGRIVDRSADRQAPQGDDGSAQRGEQAGRARAYGQTRVRLQFFREDIEFDEFDVDFDNAPDGKLRDVDRDRFGFRAEFGKGAVGGFFQVFAEEFRAPALLQSDFDHFGFGGGVVGAPAVGRAGRAELVLPFRFEVDLAGGGERAGNGFREELYYLETTFEFGFGARFFGVQPTAGMIVHSFGGLFDTDDPASIANGDPALITGTNIGAFFEVLYKHDRVPMMARVRAMVGDVSGFLISFGVAF